MDRVGNYYIEWGNSFSERHAVSSLAELYILIFMFVFMWIWVCIEAMELEKDPWEEALMER